MKKEVRIEEILEQSGKRARVRISGRLFHPSGGGQPGDSGSLEGKDFLADVLDSHGGDGGDILTIALKEGKLSSGISVTASVDEIRNLRFSRMHTGEHILSRALENLIGGLSVQKVWIGENESTIYMTYSGEIGWEELFEAEKVANRIVAEDIPVSREELSRGEAGRFIGVKVKWDRVDDERISVVSIKDFDAIACSGSHVVSTGAVGGLLVTGFKGSSPDWEVRFTVNREEVLERQSRVIRVLMRSVGCDEDTLPVVIRKLQDERRDMGKNLEKARRFLVLPWEAAGGIDYPVYIFSMDNFPSDLAVSAVRRSLQDHPESIFLFLSPPEGGGKTRFILAAGEETRVDLREVLKSSPWLEARGGGSADWVQGVAGCGSISEWKKAVGIKVDK
ncbi:MAG: hypothetical protein Q7I97_08645 [Thermovirgaceae bacterium]|nr:hypothetical protein [Thermovirgaceae bacterium]